MSDIEGKAARVAARERGQRMSFKQLRITEENNYQNTIPFRSFFFHSSL